MYYKENVILFSPSPSLTPTNLHFISGWFINVIIFWICHVWKCLKTTHLKSRWPLEVLYWAYRILSPTVPSSNLTLSIHGEIIKPLLNNLWELFPLPLNQCTVFPGIKVLEQQISYLNIVGEYELGEWEIWWMFLPHHRHLDYYWPSGSAFLPWPLLQPT